MKTHNLGYPRIGNHRELKKASEDYWSGKITAEQLQNVAREINKQNWLLQQNAGIDWVPVNDFTFYDHVLDLSLTLGAIPSRYSQLFSNKNLSELDLYFAMARGYQKDGLDIIAMEMTKWFDTNYHYIVPEFVKNQKFRLFSDKTVNEYAGAKALGINAKPVLLGPVSYLLLGKEKEEGFDRLDLIDELLPVYLDLLQKLKEQGAEYIQIDEPFLALDLCEKAKTIYPKVFQKIHQRLPDIKIILTTYFESVEENIELVSQLTYDTLHIDLVRAPQQLKNVLEKLPQKANLSLGIVDGRNIWKNDYKKSIEFIKAAKKYLGEERVFLAPSCSLLHSPCDLELEQNENVLTPEIKNWLAFAKQKIAEIVTLKELVSENVSAATLKIYEDNLKAIEERTESAVIHDELVQQSVKEITSDLSKRKHDFAHRKIKQQSLLKLPLYPTTTIGSFPQVQEVRAWRSKFKKGLITEQEYHALIEKETEEAIRWQEEAGIDVLVHGEFERNDMVEYFGEKLNGFTFTQNGWVQSYGSRCVKPPIIYGDVSRPNPMTVYWSQYAQSLTDKWVKGMLTGPVTILQWSFVRNDQPRSITCDQIALAIREEVKDLERAGIRIIQIDEPAIREGLPLKKADWNEYLQWSVNSFKLATCGVEDETQIHTHMCYSEFNDIIEDIARMDADVITIECSRSQMELLDSFAQFDYPNDIGPGVYDIHSPRIPSKEEMIFLLQKAADVIPAEQLWVNPDCGLKTRKWEETKSALIAMVAAAKSAREVLV